MIFIRSKDTFRNEIIFLFHENKYYLPWDRLPSNERVSEFVMKQYRELTSISGDLITNVWDFIEQERR